MSNNYNNKLEIFQGNTKQLLCVVYDSSSNLYDLSGYDAFLYGKKYESAGTIDISLNSTTIDPSNGLIVFDFSTTDTSLNAGDYLYEVIIDNSTNRITVLQDRLSILDSIK